MRHRMPPNAGPSCVIPSRFLVNSSSFFANRCQ
jgi:hypothetical protein